MSDTYHPHTLVLATALRDSPLQLERLRQSSLARILNAADHHGVSQLINQKIRNQSIQGVPAAERAQLAKLSILKAARDIILNESTQKTLDLLAEANIPSLLLKGTAIAFKYFNDAQSHLRTRCDTDLLIRKQDKQIIADLLTAHDYEISGYDCRKYASKQFSASLDDHSSTATTFDIHWKLSNRTLFQDTLTFEECWDARQTVKQFCEHAFTLSAEHLLIHACIHRIAHERNRDRNRLIWLYDIHLICSAFSDVEFDAFLEMAKAKKIGMLCADGLIMSQYYFGTIYPGGYLIEMMRQKSDEATAKLITASKLRWALADINALDGPVAKWGMLRELLVPAFQSSDDSTKSNGRSVLRHLHSKVMR